MVLSWTRDRLYVGLGWETRSQITNQPYRGLAYTFTDGYEMPLHESTPMWRS